MLNSPNFATDVFLAFFGEFENLLIILIKYISQRMIPFLNVAKFENVEGDESNDDTLDKTKIVTVSVY